MEIRNTQGAILGAAGVIAGLIMLSIPLAALVVGVALILASIEEKPQEKGTFKR